MGVGRNLVVEHPGRKENGTRLGQEERNAKERPKSEISCTTEEASTSPGGVDGQQERDNQHRIVLGNRGQDQAPNNNISEEGHQDTGGGYGDKRATRSTSAGQGTKDTAH